MYINESLICILLFLLTLYITFFIDIDNEKIIRRFKNIKTEFVKKII
jgi:hypothetical protein